MFFRTVYLARNPNFPKEYLESRQTYLESLDNFEKSGKNVGSEKTMFG